MVIFADPGHHRVLGGTASEQQDNKTQYQAAKAIYVSQENARAAINKALTLAVPITFRRAGGVVGLPPFTLPLTTRRQFY